MRLQPLDLFFFAETFLSFLAEDILVTEILRVICLTVVLKLALKVLLGYIFKHSD